MNLVKKIASMIFWSIMGVLGVLIGIVILVPTAIMAGLTIILLVLLCLIANVGVWYYETGIACIEDSSEQ